MKIWIVNWHTESGDKGTLGYFTQQPTEEQLEAYFYNNYEDEFPHEDPDDEDQCTCLIYWDVQELDPIEQEQFEAYELPENLTIEHI